MDKYFELISKYIFANSHYYNYYNIDNKTVLRGIQKDIGYQCEQKLSEEQLQQVSKTYRNCITILNSITAIGILLYVYLVIFPYFVEFIKLPFAATVLILSVIPLVMLLLIYISVNYFYEKYLTKHFGQLNKVQFDSNIKNIDEDNYLKYQNTPRKTTYLAIITVLIFICYAFTPVVITALTASGKFYSSVKLSSAYSKIIPINPNIYVQKAFSLYKLGKYQEAVKYYELANKYSLSDGFDYHILGLKTYILPYDDMLNEFDKAISSEENSAVKDYLEFEKIIYKMKNKNYDNSIEFFTKLINDYKADKKVLVPIEKLHYFRAVTYNVKGNTSDAKKDFDEAKKKCPECKYYLNTSLVGKP